ncbi:MAG: TOBE domain-containing protein, partial [Candidatus Puniceispirillales bacterium]
FKAEIPASKNKDKTATIFIRPEHPRLQKSTRGATLTGTLTNMLFFGTDTNYHLALDNGDTFVVRSQNEINHAFNPSIGDKLGIVIDEKAIQILKD